MPIFDTELQSKIRNRIEMLQNARQIKEGRPKVETEVLHNYHARATSGEFSFETDEPESKIGGTNKAPRPLLYFLAGLAFCTEAQYARNAILMGLDIDKLTMDVDGVIDRRDGLGLSDRDARFNEINYTTKIETSASREEVQKLVRDSEQSCYVRGTLVNPVELNPEIVVNGEPLDITEDRQ